MVLNDKSEHHVCIYLMIVKELRSHSKILAFDFFKYLLSNSTKSFLTELKNITLSGRLSSQ
jgi:hypothetical protein